MKLEFHDFKKLYSTMREVNKEDKRLPPIFDIKEFESYFSLIVALMLSVISYFLVITNMQDINNIVPLTQNILLYIIAGVIGMLGFIVAGLAMMLSTTSNTILKNIIDDDTVKYLISIFASFVYISMVIVFFIIYCLVFYLILGINVAFEKELYLIGVFILIYVFFFILFYIVSLLVTCINIFILNFSLIQEEKENQK